MERSDTGDFRITASLTQPVTVAPVLRCAVEFDGEWATFGDAFRSADDTEPVDMPDEVWLRELLDDDLMDPPRLVEFCRQWGRLGRADWTEIGALVPGEADPPGESLAPAGTGEFWPVWSTVEARHRADRQAGRWDLLYDRRWAHIGELQAHAVVLRNCVRIWLAWRDHGALFDPTAFQWEGVEMGGYPQPESTEEAVEYLLVKVRAGMRFLTPHLLVSSGDNIGGGLQWVTTYAAIMSQLYNDVVDPKPIKRCISCGGLFIRQRTSRRKYPDDIKRSAGLKFCTRRCAVRAAQKTYRAAQKKQGDPGKSTDTAGTKKGRNRNA